MSEKELPIAPLDIGGKIENISISKIEPGYERIVDIDEAVVAYFDVLGFSRKKSNEDFELTLLDFLAPLAIASTKYSSIRFNVFSDCAFVSAPKDQAKELLSSIRFAFRQWASDGISVRGGIALGQYIENRSAALKIASKNFSGNIFAGSGVVEAVKLEALGCGALLFTNRECANFYQEKFDEPIFSHEKNLIISWSDDEGILYWFLGVSLLRLLKILEHKDLKNYPGSKHLINNIIYSVQAKDSVFLQFLTYAILSLPDISSQARKKAVKIFKIKDPDDFVFFKEHIDQWLNQKEKIEFLKAIAYSDTSIL